MFDRGLVDALESLTKRQRGMLFDYERLLAYSRDVAAQGRFERAQQAVRTAPIVSAPR